MEKRHCEMSQNTAKNGEMDNRCVVLEKWLGNEEIIEKGWEKVIKCCNMSQMQDMGAKCHKMVQNATK